MINKKFLRGMVVIVLAFGVMIIGCGDPESSNNDPYVPPVKDPLAGTVAISSNVAVSVGKETMTLTADISGLDVGTNTASFYYSYQWQREGTNISGATEKTYEITEADYEKTIKVIVSHSSYTGSVEAQSTNHTPTVCTLTLKWDNAAQKKDTYIVIERIDSTYWAAVGSGSNNLTTTGTTITLTSWKETKFKMRTEYTFVGSELFFQKDNAEGSEEFDLVNGTKSYTLTNVKDNFGNLTGLFATEG